MSFSFSTRRKCFCAFCKSERIVYSRKSLGPAALLGCLLASIAAMIIIFQDFDPRAILFFVLFLVLAEIFTQIRWRLSVVCKHCGFDPVLYLKDTEKAADLVKARLAVRSAGPEAWLAKPLDLPKLKKERAEFIQNAQNLSKKVASQDAKGTTLRQSDSGKLLNRTL